MNCRMLAVAFLIFAFISTAYAKDPNTFVSDIPALQHRTAPLEASLRALRAGILKDAKQCAETASGMDATAQYHADIRKTIETPDVAGFEVSGNSQCDGEHPNAYQYAISYRIQNGKRFDLNEVYAVGHRDGGSLYLTPKAVIPVLAAFKRNNINTPSCLDGSTFNSEYLMSKAFTFAALPDGSLQLYFASEYVEAACFAPIRLDAQTVSAFKDSQKAAQYGLP